MRSHDDTSRHLGHGAAEQLSSVSSQFGIGYSTLMSRLMARPSIGDELADEMECLTSVSVNGATEQPSSGQRRREGHVRRPLVSVMGHGATEQPSSAEALLRSTRRAIASRSWRDRTTFVGFAAIEQDCDRHGVLIMVQSSNLRWVVG